MSELPSVPGGWTNQSIDLGSQVIQLTLPAAPDEFLDDPDVRRANRESDYMPYWAYLWPASIAMAKLVIAEPWVRGTRALEIGSGVGLTGIAGLVAGLDLTFSDYDPTAVKAAQRNANLNGFTGVIGVDFDWRKLSEQTLPCFDVILGCEVVYETGNHPLVLDVLDRFLSDAGVCWICDPGRIQCQSFVEMAKARGYSIEMRDQTGALVPTLDVKMPEFRLLVLRRETGSAQQ